LLNQNFQHAMKTEVERRIVRKLTIHVPMLTELRQNICGVKISIVYGTNDETCFESVFGTPYFNVACSRNIWIRNLPVLKLSIGQGCILYS